MGVVRNTHTEARSVYRRYTRQDNPEIVEEIAGGARPKLPDMPDIIEKTDPEPLDELDQAAKVEAMTAEFESITPSKAYFAPGDKIRTVFDRHCKQYEHTFTAFTWNMLAGGVQWLNANGMDAQVEYWLEKHVWLPVIDKINCFRIKYKDKFYWVVVFTPRPEECRSTASDPLLRSIGHKEMPGFAYFFRKAEERDRVVISIVSGKMVLEEAELTPSNVQRAQPPARLFHSSVAQQHAEARAAASGR